MSSGNGVNTSPLGLTTAWLVIVFGLLLVSVEASSVFRFPVVETLPLEVTGVALVALGFSVRYAALRRL